MFVHVTSSIYLSQISVLFCTCLYSIITIGWSNGYNLTQTISDICKLRAYASLLSAVLTRQFSCLISTVDWLKFGFLDSLYNSWSNWISKYGN
jgi:hypothetical protein